MNKYKVGDKIVLTVSDVNEKAYYSYYVFNNNDLILWEPSTDKYAEPLSAYTEPLEAKIRRQIEQAFDRGCNAAWELVRKIFDMETNDIEDIFIKEDAWNLGTVLNNYTYQEAAAKVEAWERQKEEIKVGDVVSRGGIYGVVKSVSDDWLNGITASGISFQWLKRKCTKTGRHIDIDSFLKQIGEE